VIVQHAHSPKTAAAKPAQPDVRAAALHPVDQSWMKKLGPGIITGAADDDPSGIATYSQAGARFGYGLLWTIVLTYPLMVAIQMISAHIGLVTGHGLATNIRRHYPAWLLYTIVGLLLVANTINIGADIAAMADATHLLLGGANLWYVLFYGVLSVVLQVMIPYVRYVRLLKWLTFALLAYVATVFVVRIPLGEVLAGTFIPRLSLNAASITMVVAVFGTTISPYLFFWQASQEVEEQHADPQGKPLKRAKSRLARAILLDVDIDTYVGMAFSNLVAFFIVLTTAATLHAHGIANIESSAQAATALRPIAGEFAYLLFTLGIVGTGLLAVPVLAGSAAYAMAGTFRWRNSLELKPTAAKKFYGIIAVATLVGAALNFVPLDPIKALFWSAVMNGVIAVPVMVVMMLMVSRRDVMGRLIPSRRLRMLGWASTAIMAAAVCAMLWSMLAG
jgi:NRAMP (natural resistance-associated macrophage protein)-like metal ion transporter